VAAVASAAAVLSKRLELWTATACDCAAGWQPLLLLLLLLLPFDGGCAASAAVALAALVVSDRAPCWQQPACSSAVVVVAASLCLQPTVWSAHTCNCVVP
jgi:hypothetical protein